LRAFIAVDFPPDMIEKIGKIIQYFKKQLPKNGVKWVSAEKLHLTIKFMGELPEKKLPAVRSIIQDAALTQPAFKIGIQGLGMYPNQSKPRVIWLGITGKEPLTSLHRILDHSLEEAGIQPERRKFSPHLTLARIRRGSDQETVREIGKTLSQFKVDSLGVIPVEHISFYKSTLTPKGPIYTLILKASLNKV